MIRQIEVWFGLLVYWFICTIKQDILQITILYHVGDRELPGQGDSGPARHLRQGDRGPQGGHQDHAGIVTVTKLSLLSAKQTYIP